MELKDVCGIAEHTGIRIVVSYSGNGKFALGLSDGSTTPIVANGTPEEIEDLGFFHPNLPTFSSNLYSSTPSALRIGPLMVALVSSLRNSE